MKNLKIFLFIVVALYSCNHARQDATQQPEEIKATVDTLLNKWHKDAAEAKFEPYFELMDSVSVFIGTDANENWTKAEFAVFCKPYFDSH